MGTLRLVLALLVLYSHTGTAPYGYNTGVFAVVGFFLLSGFVMTALWRKHYGRPGRAPLFYVDRALRLYPQYLVWLVVALACNFAIGTGEAIAGPPRAAPVVLNLLIVPNGFWFWLTPDGLYLPPTWSLGLEACFYLVVPFVLGPRARAVALVLSAAFFLLPYGQALDSDIWGYRLLPGTLFMFLAGSALFDARDGGVPVLAVAVWTFAVGLMAGTFNPPAPHVPYLREELAGLIVFLPLVWALRRQPGGVVDRVAGDLSYGVFLNHIVLVWLLRWAGVRHFGPRACLILVAASLALSAISHRWVEAPVLRLRHRRLRAREAVAA